MTISFQCSCGKKLNANDDQAGTANSCPICGQQLVIPGIAKQPPTKKVAVASPVAPPPTATVVNNPYFDHGKPIGEPQSKFDVNQYPEPEILRGWGLIFGVLSTGVGVLMICGGIFTIPANDKNVIANILSLCVAGLGWLGLFGGIVIFLLIHIMDFARGILIGLFRDSTHHRGATSDRSV